MISLTHRERYGASLVVKSITPPWSLAAPVSPDGGRLAGNTGSDGVYGFVVVQVSLLLMPGGLQVEHEAAHVAVHRAGRAVAARARQRARMLQSTNRARLSVAAAGACSMLRAFRHRRPGFPSVAVPSRA